MSLRQVEARTVKSLGDMKVYFTKTRYFWLTTRAYARAVENMESCGVWPVGRDGRRILWLTRAGWFWADSQFNLEDVDLLVWDREQKQRARLDRLRRIRIKNEDLREARRDRIPAEVQNFVWQRDEGRCVQCNAEDNLHYDHVIPVAKGGGNDISNIQILCQDCNLAKSDSIGG